MNDYEKKKLNRLAGFLEGLSYSIADDGVVDAIQTVVESMDELIDGLINEEVHT